MLDKISLRKGNIIFLLITFGLIYLIFSCAPAPTKSTKGKIADIVEEGPAKIELLNVIPGPSDKEATIEITSSKPVSYAAFLVDQPLRLIVDIGALPVKGLTGPDVFNGKIIKAIHLEEIKDRPKSTRLIATLSRDVEYRVQEKDRVVKLLLLSKKPVEKLEKQPLPIATKKEEEIGPKEPRLFFSAGKTKLNQVLGIDFFTLLRGKSRIIVTTSKKAEYELSRKDSLTLLLQIKEAAIPSELTRYIDSSQFKGVINRITPIVKVADRVVDLEIGLKEMVPYHLTQADKEIRLDFNKTSVKPPAKNITPARLTKALVKTEEVPNEAITAFRPGGLPSKFKGARMTLDFANADIRNILKLIGEISKLNIVWGPEVKGTVSMRLKNVPWDQALSLLLETNNLGTRVQGNIVWITTKAKIVALEKEEQEKLKAEQERIKEAKAAQKEVQKEAKAEEPLITEYIIVNYQDVDAIKILIEENVKGPRGRLSVDKATKTIIYTDIASNIKEAKELKERQDRPVKQVMIEARIVEADTSFSRDIGVEWTGSYNTTRSPWGGFGPGGVYKYDFATNFTLPSATTMGINFANTAATRVLTAQIALAETEGKAKTLSAPKIVTRDTVTATIKQGTKIVIPTGTDQSGNKTYQQVDATLKLEVTPTITPNDMVIMTIDVSEDEPDYAHAIGENIPIKTKNANTQMMVASGDTVIIGGIYKESKSDVLEATPWLSKIPILGWLFKRELRSISKTELLIFITPTVLPISK